MSDEIERLKQRLERERSARKEAEGLLEKKSLELYHANQSLQASASNLEREVERRTDALSHALLDAKNANLQLNEARRALEQQLFAIDQHTIVSIADTAGNITYANQLFVDISGYPLDELIGANHRIVNSGTHPKELFEALWHTISSGKVWSGELCNRRKDGSLYWVSATMVPFLDEEGLPQHYMSIRSDITPLKQAEASLRNTVFDLNERVKEWTCLNKVTQALQNEALNDADLLDTIVRLLPPGWLAPDETHARICYRGDSFITPGFQESVWRQVAAISNGGPEDRIEVFRIAPSENGVAFLEQEQVLLGSIASQIGQAMERRRTRTELLAARDAAEAANQAKSDFLANMSHEIRTPMNGIIGMTDLALDAHSESERKEYMEIVRRSADSLLGIINDILDFSKIEAGKLVVEQVGFDLARTVNECLHPLLVRAKEKQLAFCCDIDENVPPYVAGDPTRLRQVLVNLAGNAIKFTDSGEISIRIEVVGVEDDRTHLRFSVKDSGIGIPQDKLGTIFESFSQADTSTTRKYGGSGLGLTITQRLVGLMGGSLTVESCLGSGSTFQFTLPLMRADGPSMVSPESKPVLSMSPMRILLVEDHPINQKLAIHLLEKWGHQVTLAENGQEALSRLCAGERFAVVLMDMQMPVMGGIEATQRIRAMEKERNSAPHKIVAMTANAMQGDRDACLAAGMDDYLSKPITQSELTEKLSRHGPSSTGGCGDFVNQSAEAISTIPAFDYRTAISAMDAEIIDILRPAFLEHYAAECADLQNALDALDADEVVRRAHGLKGTLAAFGAEPAERRAAEIESLAKANDLVSVGPLVNHLLEAIEQLTAILRAQ
jgi:PAS domain S-box-containing protein